MFYKKFVMCFINLTIFIFVVVVGINYYFDFYAVFNSQKYVYYGNINDRFAKMSYILDNKDKYNSFLWGSSRVQKMNPNILEDRCYNMGAEAGLPEDCLRDLNILLKNDLKIKNIYLGIDNFSYKNNYSYAITALNRTPYSEKSFYNIKYLTKVILKLPELDKIKIYMNLVDDSLGKTYLVTSGTYNVPDRVEADINSSIDRYVYDNKFNNPTLDQSGEHINETINIIKNIKQICDDNNINLVVFFNPVHITSYLKDDIEISNRFKKELANITDFYDFNYINFITVNNYFWYETSHPRYFVCDWQLKVITNQYDEKIPKDFGHLVTKKNVDYYCNKYKIDKENFKMPEKQYIPEYPII